MSSQAQTTLKNWLKLSLVTFLVLTLIHLALPGLFLLFQVPSFTVGDQTPILQWRNDETGSGIQFNLAFLLAIALVVSLVVALARTGRSRRS